MIELTKEQRKSLQDGTPIPVFDDGQEYVLIGGGERRGAV
jgi:hypothetical protein